MKKESGKKGGRLRDWKLKKVESEQNGGTRGERVKNKELV